VTTARRLFRRRRRDVPDLRIAGSDRSDAI